MLSATTAARCSKSNSQKLRGRGLAVARRHFIGGLLECLQRARSNVVGKSIQDQVDRTVQSDYRLIATSEGTGSARAQNSGPLERAVGIQCEQRRSAAVTIQSGGVNGAIPAQGRWRKKISSATGRGDPIDGAVCVNRPQSIARGAYVCGTVGGNRRKTKLALAGRVYLPLESALRIQRIELLPAEAQDIDRAAICNGRRTHIGRRTPKQAATGAKSK